MSGLVEEAVADAEASNEWRDKLHLPETPVPVDTSTVATQTLECRLHEKLNIGGRVWTVTTIAADQVTLTPGHDHERHPREQGRRLGVRRRWHRRGVMSAQVY